MKNTLVFSFVAFLLLFASQTNAQLRLTSGQRLDKGQKITAGLGELYMQEDGNLVFYHINTPKWATMTNGKTVTHCIMQPDGNLVIYNGTYPVWASDTWNVGAGGGYFEIHLSTFKVGIYKPDGTLVKLLQEGNPTIATTLRMNSGQTLNKGQKITAGTAELIMQEDGNLVVYNNQAPIWASGTNGKTVTHCIMQADGNLVVYNNSTRVWSSDTDWAGGYLLYTVETNEVCIYSADGSLVRRLNSAKSTHRIHYGKFNANY
ncbi:MAG: hypothetical protein H6577_20690 [Lewinellaceae bacterium]|nr:hypothetical protein [Saprospiraceae bacterium]MCB9340549.1 hypothetical protein [Lewinellaceae bacterium]